MSVSESSEASQARNRIDVSVNAGWLPSPFSFTFNIRRAHPKPIKTIDNGTSPAVRAGFLPLDNISATDRLTAVANDTLAF